LRRIHVLRVEEEPDVFGPLLLAAAAAGLRVGWLELASPPPPPPEELRRALLAGGERALAVAEGWTLSVRARRGAPRLRELLRAQFAGCAAVLVRGQAGVVVGVEAPRLAPLAEGTWSVRAGEHDRRLDTAGLVSALREPRPFPPAEPVR